MFQLAPRDVVSRTILSEMRAQKADHMYLDISHRPADWIRDRFPSIYEHCLQHGYDMTVQPLPVVPAAHYFCGGVTTDLEGRTSVPGLFAAGEKTRVYLSILWKQENDPHPLFFHHLALRIGRAGNLLLASGKPASKRVGFQCLC